MKKTLILFLALCIATIGVRASCVPDNYVDIGDTISEQCHSVNGWSGIWDWGGGYGGGDGSNLGSQTLRTIIPRSQDCEQDDKIAYFSLGTQKIATQVQVRHLQGSQNDNYELYYKTGESWDKA